MILAFHSIFSMYGFWLPNDPRGSGSDYIAAWELLRYGPATKTNAKRSVAYVPHDHALRLKAKEALNHPAVQITGCRRSPSPPDLPRRSRRGPTRFMRVRSCRTMCIWCSGLTRATFEPSWAI